MTRRRQRRVEPADQQARDALLLAQQRADQQSRRIDRFWGCRTQPAVYYLTGGGHVSHAMLIKKCGEDAILFHGDMERDEAAKSGLKCIPYSKYDYDELLKQANKDSGLANAMRAELMFMDAGVTSGRVGGYGMYDVGSTFGLLMAMQKLLPEIEFVGQQRDDSIFMRAMETKDKTDVERIRKMAKITTEVVGLVRDYLTSCDVDPPIPTRGSGSDRTVGPGVVGFAPFARRGTLAGRRA